MVNCLSWKCFAADGRNFNALLGALVALLAVVLPEDVCNTALSGLLKKFKVSISCAFSLLPEEKAIVNVILQLRQLIVCSTIPGLLGHTELVPPGVGQQRVVRTLGVAAQATLATLAPLHPESSVLLRHEEGTAGQGGGGAQQQQPAPHRHNCSRRCTRTGLEVQQHCFCT